MIETLRVVIATLLDLIAWPILLYFVLINSSYLVLVIAAAVDFRSTRRRRRHSGRVERLGSHTAPGAMTASGRGSGWASKSVGMVRS